MDRFNTDPGISFLNAAPHQGWWTLVKDVSYAPWIAKLRNNEGCYMVGRFGAGSWADMTLTSSARLLQKSNTGRSCWFKLSALLCPGGAQNKGESASCWLLHPFSIQPCPSEPLHWVMGVLSFEFATTNIGRFELLSALPTEFWAVHFWRLDVCAVQQDIFTRLSRDGCHNRR